MPWVVAQLRGQKVWARTTAAGALASDGGRVEIRYKKDDPRAYRAAAGNLTVEPGAEVLADDAIVAGAAVESDAKGSGTASGATAKGGTRESRRSANAKTANANAAKIGPDTWIAYTDGACSGNPGPCGAGFIVVAPGGKILEGFDYLGIGTNNVGELTAVMRALEVLPEGESAIVHTDSKYAIGVLSQGWKAKANVEPIAKIKKLVTTHPNARFVYVPGHAGVALNERADELAREAIRSRRTDLTKMQMDKRSELSDAALDAIEI
jgi:ribonuclease HI